ncbi:beta-N-acetylhexosaminidase [Thermosporothrix hazakensis]|jgi:beta-N-acetylhexosaminidase|uniref:Beta-N-acetylhexosaminidase n=2 Tax=Thermosporothrix TaxID=768650 RepID=A0A326UF71_THEHA|nr:beta-N-acetylhexosaminidase [Thermosporothrix hazakensis]PZW36521.1 beta-N-acetylhexosaminidase [Thermosporothrix hazakensis]BBH88987.1 beta-glucosidase [Thermosporothrix sp. COM3]GCE47173.1 beta-glucosidase [Thermosporothrix hazakensis]
MHPVTAKLAADMSIDEQIGQLFVVGFHGTTPSPDIVDLIKNHHVGNIILFSRNVQDTAQVRALTYELQRIAHEAGHRYPLLITVDQENGMVQRLGKGSTAFPGNMALGATGSIQLVQDVAYACGQELKALGINMNLAPVVDINNNPANPVIGNRSFSEVPQDVARMGVAALEGYARAGVISCLKHFPGHGDTAVDSHLSLPVIAHSLERLEQVELVPFKAGIAAGADSIMTAHVYFPTLIEEEGIPATLSSTIIRGLLRQRLGYQGVVISDCLEMNAISKTFGFTRGSVMALQAGIDLVLISHVYEHQLEGLNAIREAVAKGVISEEIIQEALERVLELKARRLSWEDTLARQTNTIVNSPEHQELSTQAYERSTTVIKDEAGLLPLRLQPEQRVLLVYPQKDIWTKATDQYHQFEVLAHAIRERHPQVTAHAYKPVENEATPTELLQAANEADLIIAVTVNANIDRAQAQVLKDLQRTGRPLIGIAGYNPYDLLAFPELTTYLVTYEYTAPALTAAARVLFGEISAQGHLPVSLPGLYEHGHHL